MLFLAIRMGAGLLKVALIVRVISSWFGRGEYSRWLRPAYWLTDWLIRPLRRVVPPVGMFDLTPLVLLVAAQVALIPIGHLRAVAAGW